MITSVWTNLLGAVLAIVLIITVINTVPDLLPDNVSEGTGVNTVIEALKETAEKADQAQHTFTVNVPSGGAIVVMDEGNFTYNHDEFNPDRADEFTHITAFFMERPSSCGDDTCVCQCNTIDLADMPPDEFNETFGVTPSITMANAEIMCNQPTCAEANVSLKEKQRPFRAMTTPPEYAGPDAPLFASYGLHYWRKSFIFLNTFEMRPNERINDVLVTTAGYAGKLPQSTYTVTLQNNPEGILLENIVTGTPTRTADG